MTDDPKRMGWSLAAASSVAAVFVLSNAPTPLYVRWQAEWGLGSGTMTVVFAAYMAGLVGALVTGGRLADRYGRRAVLVPGVAVAAVACVLFLSADNVYWLLAARLLTGVSSGAAITAGMAATVDLAPGHRRRTGSLLASTSVVLGVGLGVLFSGALAQASHTPETHVFGAVLALELAALAVASLLPLRRPSHGRAPSRLWSWPSVPTENRRDLALGIATFAPGITAGSFFLSLGPVVLADGLGRGGALVAGATACAMFFTSTGVQFALAALSTRTHLALSSVAAVASMAVLAVGLGWRSPVLFGAAALLAGAAQGLGQLAGLTLIATNVPVPRRAEANAALSIAGYVPAAVLPVGTGFLVDATGLEVGGLTFAAVLAVVALTALAAVRRATRPAPALDSRRSPDRTGMR